MYSTRKILSLKKIIFYFSGFFLSIIFALVLCEFVSRIFFGGVFRNDPVLTRNSENALNYNGNQYTKGTRQELNLLQLVSREIMFLVGLKRSLVFIDL